MGCAFLSIAVACAYSGKGEISLVLIRKKVTSVNATIKVAVGSVTNAMRGKEILQKNGITAYVGRVAPDQTTGCGYMLMVAGDITRAEQLLTAAGIRVRRLS